MPVYMDLHIGQGLTSEAIAKAHQLDLQVQDKFNCNCLTYWFDEPRGNAYCLIEAPNKAAVYELHKNSHEQLPDEIIEVDRRVIKAFLGRIHDPEVVDYIIDQKIKIFNDPAFRVIIIVRMKDEILLQNELGKVRSRRQFSKANSIIRRLITKNSGIASEDNGQEIVATFTSAIQAVLCSLDIHNFLAQEIQNLDIRIGVHAGQPVETGKELFGAVLKFNKFLCDITKNDTILISNTVKNLLLCSNNSSLLGNEKIQNLFKADEEFIAELIEVLEDNWQNSDFEMEDCYKAMSMSKSQLYRRCVETTGTSSNRLLRDFRLLKARNMLLGNELNVAQTAFECGFNSPSYFTKCFQKKFGLKPHLYSEVQL
jgi:AraC-like DNA-binding protein